MSLNQADLTLVSTRPEERDAPETKRAFIRATEIWVPSKDRTRLEHGGGIYGTLESLEAISRQMTFGYDEGLPGKAWSSGRPIVLKNLNNSYFKRGEEASAAGLTCGVALPIFAGPFIMAVLVLLCGEDKEHIGAIELWRTPPESKEMGLVDGYFGSAESFEFHSRHTKFMRGFGLPGKVWETGMPLLMEDLGRSRRFVRRRDAEKVGINRGVGIPCGRDGDGAWVLTLLSALGTPIALRFECWIPDEQQDCLTFGTGFCESAQALDETYAKTKVPAAHGGTLGNVWRGGIPAICENLSQEPEHIARSAAKAGLSTLVAIPVISDCTVKAVVAWYL